MALVEKYHVVATQFDVDPNSLEIKEGMLVALNAANGVRRVTTGDAGKVLGVAGDTFSTGASALPGVGTGYISGGNTVSFQNRVSDGFDETKASGKITVYHSGGEFATDMFVDSNMEASDVGAYLVADEATGTLQYGGTDLGELLAPETGPSTPPVAMLVKAAGTYPSGVPGVDLNGDIALGGANSSQYIEFKLLV